MDQIWLWVGFNVFVLAMLALDLPKAAEAHDPVEHDPLEPKSDPAFAPIEDDVAGDETTGHRRG